MSSHERASMLQVAVLVAAVGVFLAACSSSQPRCIPGASDGCVGAGACSGFQVCQSDGTYGACQCAAPADGGSDAGNTEDRDAGVDGGPDGGNDGGLDAGPGAPCDPVFQTGCALGQRCTRFADGLDAGEPICVADGTQAEAAPCEVDAGLDNCQRGLVCKAGLCDAICSADAGACGPNTACSHYLNGDDACVPQCDPLTEVRLTDSAPACGSPNPSAPIYGCYGAAGGVFTCERAGSAANTSDAPISGTPALNACAVGFDPLLVQSSSSLTSICVAVC